MYYFAYGSNMLTRRLATPERAPSARAVAVGTLPGRRLRFHKLGLDGSGKCDAELTEVSADEVHGVLFEIDRRDKLVLDRLECTGGGYATIAVSVQLAHDNVAASTYVAQRTSSDVMPFDWYKALVIAGALEHELPAEYIAALRAVAAVGDPDAARRRHHAELVATDQV
jgi:hypothetical protein